MDHILEGNERILVCLSPSPSNKKVVEAAAKMARAFQAALTAIYIKPTNYHLIFCMICSCTIAYFSTCTLLTKRLNVCKIRP